MAKKNQTEEPLGFNSEKSKINYQIGCINDELKNLSETCELLGIEVENEIGSIGDSLEIIESATESLETEYDDLKEELDELKSKVEELEEAVDDRSFTKIRSLEDIDYFATNHLDKQIMEQLDLCLKSGKVLALLEHLTAFATTYQTAHLIPEH